MADFRNPFDFDFTKLMGDAKLPGLDVEAIMTAQRRNLEALSAANQQAANGVRAVAERQAQILQDAMTQASEAVEELADAEVEDMAAVQTALVKSAFEQAVSNMRELSEMVTQAQTEALETINQRVATGLDELKDTVGKSK